MFMNEAPFASYRKRRLDWQVVPLIIQGKRPQYTFRVQASLSPVMWKIMEDCWATKPERRCSAEEIAQRLHTDVHDPAAGRELSQVTTDLFSGGVSQMHQPTPPSQYTSSRSPQYHDSVRYPNAISSSVFSSDLS